MKITVCTIFLIIFLGYGSAGGQEYLLKLNQGVETFCCKDININEDKVSFINIENDYEIELALADILSINFYKDKPDQINIYSLQIDTIKCTIDSISRKKIRYRLENNVVQSIDKKDVFCIQYGELSNQSKIDLYRKQYFWLRKSEYIHKPVLIRQNGNEIEIKSLIGYNDEKIEFEYIKNGVDLKTFLNASEIKSIILKNPTERGGQKYYKNYHLSNEGRFMEIIIDKIYADKLKCRVFIKENLVPMELEKRSLNTLLFYDYSMLEEQASLDVQNNTYIAPGTNQTDRKVYAKFGFNAGIGYSIASAPSDFTAEMEKYVDEMRLGFALDANMNVFITDGFAIGCKFNRYTTSNSIVDIAEDNIAITFIGASIVGNQFLPNDIGCLYTSVSVGSCKEVNNAKVLGQSIKIEGSTIGVYFSLGVDFKFDEGFAIGFQSGALFGIIDEAKVDGQKVELEDDESLARLDGMVGLKLYF